MPNSGFTKPLRTLGYERQHGKCAYCQGSMSENVVHPVKAWMVTLEHLIQKRRGGQGKPNNTVAACHACNNARPCGMPASHYAMLRQLLLPVWEACTHPPAHVKKTLVGLERKMPKGDAKG